MPDADAWDDYLALIDYAAGRYREWRAKDVLSQPDFDAVALDLGERSAAAAKARGSGEPFNPDRVLAPSAAGDPAVRRLAFLRADVLRQRQGGRIRLATAHALEFAVRAELAAAMARAEPSPGPPLVLPAPPRPEPALSLRAVLADTADDDEPPPPDAPPPRNLLEILLDPHTIHWLFALGGGLFVVGLVVYLVSLGVLDNPLAVAGLLGAGNLALLGGGLAVTARTRYRLAGRALTLLACLVMPLNLWFYHAHGLLTLEGKLWAAGLVISGLYAASARVLRDAAFVPVLIGGVAMTGLLLLADLGRFYEVVAPAAFLVGLGLACVHAERAFAPGEGPFSRERFGAAFYWSGQVALAAGLLFLLGSHAAGVWLYEPLFRPAYEALAIDRPIYLLTPAGKGWALALALAGAWGYAYSDVVVRRVGWYVFPLGACLAWAEALALDLLSLQVGPDAVVALLAATGLAVNAAWAAFRGGEYRRVVRAFPAVGLVLTVAAVAWGLVLFARSTPAGGRALGPHEAGWGYVGAMAVAALAARAAASMAGPRKALAGAYFFATAAATLAGAAGLLGVLGVSTFEGQGLILMLIPVAYLAAARLYDPAKVGGPLAAAAHASAAALQLAALAAAPRATPGGVLQLAALFAEAAAFYALAAAWRRRGANVLLGTTAAAVAVWLLLHFAGAPSEAYALTYAGLGFALLVGYRLGTLDRPASPGVAAAAFDAANALMTVAFLAGLFMTLGRLAAAAGQTPALAVTLTVLAALAGAAAWLVRHEGWRAWYLLLTVGHAGLLVLVLNVLITLSPGQKLESLAVAAGGLLLAAGHVGWYREGDARRSDAVTAQLWLGSLLVGVPLLLAATGHRAYRTFHTPDEVGLFAAGLAMAATGLAFRLQATTLTGSALLAFYVLGLLFFIRWEEIQTAALVMIAGGGGVFGLGLVLSVFRERLLALPERVKNREGVFRVLDWR